LLTITIPWIRNLEFLESKPNVNMGKGPREFHMKRHADQSNLYEYLSKTSEILFSEAKRHKTHARKEEQKKGLQQ
jgi:hypothetical protein